MRRRWRRLGLLAGLLAAAWALVVGVGAMRARLEFRSARAEMARGRMEPARRRLAALAAARPGALGGAVEYWLGVCEATLGDPDAALRAFARVPDEFAFDAQGAYLEARANLAHGRLRAAERRLEQALTRGGPDLEPARALLRHIYEIEVRFDDAKALLRTSLDGAPDPIRVLKELSNYEQDRVPADGLRAALGTAGHLAPEEDRVWLGLGRLAILAGRWEEAEAWLRRCLVADADAPSWRSWLEWARGAGRPEEAVRAAQHLGDSLTPGEQWALRAWLEEQHGDTRAEARALERWLRAEPAATRALERLAELAHRDGRTDRVSELRRRRAEVGRALERYRLLLWRDPPPRGAAERFELARLAEAAGRRAEAKALFTWVLAVEPGHVSARDALARLDREEADRRREPSTDPGPWPALTPVRAGRTGQAAEPVGRVAFTDDAEAAGLRFAYDTAETPIHQTPELFGGGVAVLDYDGDGWLDVYCVQGGPFSTAPGRGGALFRNRGDGTFVDATDAAGLDRLPRGHGFGVAVCDYDNDGDADLFITRWRSYVLYRNRGDGTFEDATDAAGLGGDRDWPSSAAFADLDGDGDLDLYVGHYAAWDYNNPRICRDANTHAYLSCGALDCRSLPDHLLRNDGGRFVDVSAEAGITAADVNGHGLGVVAADLDDDGRIDLFVANDATANFLFRNRGGLRFEEVAHEAGVAANANGGYQAGMGVACGDFDGDGRPDLAVTNFYGESTTLFRNLGGGTFTDATATVGLAATTRQLLGFGVALFDADNDGYLDMATANGHVNDLRPNYPYRMPAQLLLGGPDGRMVDVSDRAGAPWLVPRMGRGLAVADLDNDGRQDVLIVSHGQPLAYLHNRSDGGRWLTVRLEGRESNRDAVGAKVVVIAGGRRFVAQRVGGGSYQSATDPRLHFGLGPAERVEAIEVTWPSGRVDRHLDLRSNAGYLLREEAAAPQRLPGRHQGQGSSIHPS
jgi:tetratricopeptide (TPR) repeat protein